jgi:hypothetical protein
MSNVELRMKKEEEQGHGVGNAIRGVYASVRRARCFEQPLTLALSPNCEPRLAAWLRAGRGEVSARSRRSGRKTEEERPGFLPSPRREP